MEYDKESNERIYSKMYNSTFFLVGSTLLKNFS